MALQEKQMVRRVYTISLWDFEVGEEYPLVEPGELANKFVYQKVCVELLGELFR